MSDKTLNKETLNVIFNELAKEYCKLGGKKVKAELILVGGAAVIENYTFREMTSDVDAIIMASSVMKDAATRVGDKYGLQNNWLNSDFVRTKSYSERLSEVSQFYKCFCGILDVRIVSAEYLIAMKIKSGRKYKNDLSDIVGILFEHQKSGNEITREQVDSAVIKLYGDWSNISEDTILLIDSLFEKKNYKEIMKTIKENEEHAKQTLVRFQENYPRIINTQNVDEILKMLNNKK